MKGEEAEVGRCRGSGSGSVVVLSSRAVEQTSEVMADGCCLVMVKGRVLFPLWL